MGRPCCGVFRCQEPLQNNRHRFCAFHFSSHDICAVVGCNNSVLEVTTIDPNGVPLKLTKKTCSLSLHQEMEKKHHERSTGSFLYKERLQHAKISQPVDSFSDSRRAPEQDIQEDFETFAVNDQGKVIMHIQKNPGTVGTLDNLPPLDPCPSKSAAGNRTLKAQFGR